MFQPEEIAGRAIPATDDLAAFVIPTSRETTDKLAEPPHGCPETPGRECMIRYLYAQRHHHAVKCATCGQMSGRASSFKRAHKVKAATQAPAGPRRAAPKPKARVERTAEQQAQIKQRQRERFILALDKGRAAQVAAKAAALEAKMAGILAARDAATSAAEALVYEKQYLTCLKLKRDTEARRARRAAQRGQEGMPQAERDAREARIAAENQQHRAAVARAKAELSMAEARKRKKTASRVESVVIVLDWCIANGIAKLSVRDFNLRVGAMSRSVACTSGHMGTSLRKYGLTVRLEHRGGARQTAMLHINDKVRDFVDGGWIGKVHAMGLHNGGSNG